MASIKEQLDEDFKHALRAKNKAVLNTLRMLRAAIMNKAIDLRKKDEGLNEEEIIAVAKSEIKKLKDAMEDFEKGRRIDLVEKNKKEIEILKKYLPAEMSEEEIKIVVKKIIEEMNAGSSDVGKVMGRIMSGLKGKADGGLVRKIVQEELG